MRFIIGALATLVALFSIAAVLLRTPPTEMEAMRAKYGGADARYASALEGRMEVHYRDKGYPHGETIILIHGSNASLHTWEPLAERLQNGWRVVRYDQPGHGITGEHPDGDYGADGMIDALEAVVAAAGVEEFFLAGNSMGGWVAWNYAIEHPERVKGLILLDASGAPLPEGVEPPSNLAFKLLSNPLGRMLINRYTPRFLVERSLAQTVSNKDIVTPEAVDRYWELARLPENRRATLARAKAEGRLASPEVLQEVFAPTLVLWGEEDAVVPVQSADYFAKHIPDADLVVFDGIGHLPHEEAPDAVAREIDAFADDVLNQAQ